MKERILILGAGTMQGPAIAIAKEMGLFTIVADGDPHAACASWADRFEHIDLKDREGIEALGRSLRSDGGLGGIMTAGTDFSATVAWAAEKLGLPGIPWEAALNASDKERMRSCFKKAGIPSPEFTVMKDPPKEDSLPFSYPVVVKPVDNMGSRGCRRADTFEALREAVEDSLRFSRSGRAIVESYMEGPEFSVDALVYHGEITICGLADRHICFPPYFIEMGHTIPTSLDPHKQAELLDCFRNGVRALGIAGDACCGAAKGDIKLTPSGPMIGEIAARLSGGYMSGWTYPYASGVEPTRGAILAALGKAPAGLDPLRNWTCAERAFISIPGKVRSITGAASVRNYPFVKDAFFRIGEGGAVQFPINNVTKCGNIIAAAPDRERAVSAAEAAGRSILIHLEAPDRDTAAFLSAAGSNFPPDAFTISPEITAILEKLPDSDIGAIHINAPAGDIGAIHENASTGGIGAIHINALPVAAFPEFTESGLKDYAGRSIAETLDAVRRLTGLPLPVVENPQGLFFGRDFWAALIRGGYQGAVYIIDCARNEAGSE